MRTLRVDDDEKSDSSFFLFQILFPVWVTLSEHKRVILRERPRLYVVESLPRALSSNDFRS